MSRRKRLHAKKDKQEKNKKENEAYYQSGADWHMPRQKK